MKNLFRNDDKELDTPMPNKPMTNERTLRKKHITECNRRTNPN